MPHAFRDIAFTPSVRAAQEAQHSHAAAEIEGVGAPENAVLTESEAIFLARSRSLYLASVSETGWPYIQHRGGPAGFVKVLEETLIGWAEYSGNRHYITTGNLAGEDRVSLIVMDYARKTRLKLFGRASLIDPDDARMSILTSGDYKARVERGLLVRIEGFDWNCPQHIPPLFTPQQVETASENMLKRIAELEKELEQKS